MRVFVAVDLAAGIRDALAALVSRLRERSIGDVRWVRAEGIHLTLRFLGEIDPGGLERLSRGLASGAPVSAFPLRLGGVGMFPPRGAPRVLMVETEESPPLSRLAGWVESRAVEAGFPAERRPFHPHLTLGRFREGARRVSDDPSLVPPGWPPPAMTVDQYFVFRSHLEREGARYEKLAAYPLSGGRAA